MNKLRTYKKNTKQHDLYKTCHQYQTFDFVQSKLQQYSKKKFYFLMFAPKTY